LYELHTAPARIGEVAQAANVGRVVLSHLPNVVAKQETQVLRSVASTFDGEVRMAVDCMRIAVGDERSATNTTVRPAENAAARATMRPGGAPPIDPPVIAAK